MALQRAEMTIDEASDAWFSDHFHSAGSRQRGDYETCLRTWREVFSDEQILVLRFEHLATEPELLLNRCFPTSWRCLSGTRTVAAAGLSRAGFYRAGA
jgi:hypothetical protein